MPDQITAIITLTSRPNDLTRWHAETGHPDVPTSYLTGAGQTVAAALAQLAERIQANPLAFLRAQNIQVILPET